MFRILEESKRCLSPLGQGQPQIKIIVNPAAGGGRPLKVLPEVLAAFKKLGITPDYEITAGPQAATALARSAADNGYQIVVSLGGDGTVNEVASGLVGTSTALAVIPAGSGNDFFRMLNLPKRIPALVQKIVENKFILADIGLVNEKIFVNNLGFGFVGETAARMKKNSHRPGLLGYLGAALKIFFKSRPVAVTIQTEKFSGPHVLFLGTIANGHSMGGGFKLAPLARLNDGRLDVCLVDYRQPRQLFRHLPRAAFGRHQHLPFVKMFQCLEIQVISETPLTAHYDGEVFQTSRLDVKIRPGQLKVIGGRSKES